MQSPCPASSPSPSADDSSVGSPPRFWDSPTNSSDVVSSCRNWSPDDFDSPPKPLRLSTTTNHHLKSTPSPSRRKSSKKHSPEALLQIKYKVQMRARRQQCTERANRIKSLDNSPVNDHQLHVLRMVYDQITMYPPESWTAILAIVIRRSLKQVKNWFSNERQKNKDGAVEKLDTLEGDKVKFRPLAVNIKERWPGCPAQWSDEFFEEVVMIYDYMVLTHLRANDPSA
ncbi:hypothetical protein FA13DRAFT_1724937 [Coprinellus micaceus]|uniref:Homeobox domain-containing protein n=1 Tax=Coprinellus micaceus TaxID=71717 RepID=A0A4Y7TXT3_COPMI|nr:hypothetical protein FA13DRAFT_1724937 [Coprinellus micaceus]